MVKKILGLITLLFLANTTFATDVLNGTKWQTIDDKTKKVVSIVQFKETSSGTFSAKIIEITHPKDIVKCVSCSGIYQNKPLQGLQIVSGLKLIEKGKYENGKIIDPQNGKTYSFNANLSADGQVLSGRGYIGIAALGRDQTWIRTK